MSRKPHKPAVARSLHNHAVSDRDAAAGASPFQSAPTVSVEPAQPTPEVQPEVIIVETPDDPEPFVVTAESPEELVRSAFALLASRIGDRPARELWAIVLKRRRGRPPNSIKYHPAMFQPGIRQFARKMPNAKLTEVITAFVKDIESNGIKVGLSTKATVSRLVRAYEPVRKLGHFPMRPGKKNA
jgi:hypothetical protein